MGRVLEGLTGIILAVASVVPLMLAVGLPFTMGGPNEWPWSIGGSLVSALLFAWCAKTSWRLVSGRPRTDRWLVSTWLIVGGGIAAATAAAIGLWQFGALWIDRAIYLGTIGVWCFELARRRFKRRSRPPLLEEHLEDSIASEDGDRRLESSTYSTTLTAETKRR